MHGFFSRGEGRDIEEAIVVIEQAVSVVTLFV
jgi:hypothetical protein